MKYYILYEGNQIGPMTKEEMMAYNVNAQTPVMAEDSSENYKPLVQYPELMQMLQAMGKNDLSDNKKMVCGILALLIGGIGLQYFLIGKTAGGIINILLTLVTCGAWSLINFVQGIIILCMSDAEFKRKFVDSTATYPLF